MKLLIFSFLSLFLLASCFFFKTGESSIENDRSVSVHEETAKTDFKVHSAEQTYIKGGYRTVGHLYTFVLTPLVDNIQIHSVWFGAKPVPADIKDYETHTPVSGVEKGKKIMLIANQDLYKNFFQDYDSTKQFNHFKPPFPFEGQAIIIYNRGEEEKYLIIQEVENKGPKNYR